MKKIIICLLLLCSACTKKTETTFNYWHKDASSLNTLTTYVEEVTNEKSEYFIPQEDRIAIFDLDGTLLCETFPIYIEWLIFKDYVLNHQKQINDPELIDLAQTLDALKSAKDIPLHMEEIHISAHAKAFKDLTLEEYEEVVKTFREKEAEGYQNLKIKDAFYLPMLEIINYLIEHDFMIYICSGTGRFTVRYLIEDIIDIPAYRIIGTDFDFVASNQNDENPMHYHYQENDEIIFEDELIIKNIKMSKVTQTIQEIGQKAVLTFGNSSGDYSLAHYNEEGNPYLTKTFFVLCDDIEREYGNLDKALNIKNYCLDHGWETISMANDWNTIFGEHVRID